MRKSSTLITECCIMYTVVLLFAVRLANSAAIGLSLKTLPYRCTSSPDWVGSGCIAQDCSAAITRFSHFEVAIYGKKKYEFMGANAARAHRPLAPQYLPMKFTEGN